MANFGDIHTKKGLQPLPLMGDKTTSMTVILIEYAVQSREPEA
jgi:hypothetical protein